MYENTKNLTIAEASEKLKNGEISSLDLTKEFLTRIKKINPKINAYITILEKEALKSAKASDERRANGKILSQIDGLPMAVKDNMAMEQTKTTAGSKILENFIAPYDATVIAKLKEAGAVILGKTNLDEFAMGSSTETSYFGPTRNPWDTTRVPGGSSGGSAAAVAANLCLGALGSDTGGSIRQPASFCGIVGFKPTYGAVSRYGLLAMASSLDQIGPMTKTVEDAEIILGVIAGFDSKDSTSIPNDKILMTNKISNDKLEIRNWKLGIPREYFAEGLDQKVKKVIEKAIDDIKNLGAEIKEISLPNTKYALSCYYIIMPVEVSSNLARYDGIKYGYSEVKSQKSNSEGIAQAKVKSLLDVYLETRSQGFGKEAKRRIMLGTYTSSAGYIDQYYNKAQKVRTLIKKDFDKAFREVDFVLGPVSPEVAFRFGEKTADPLKMYLSDIYTIAVNLAGLPAISVPTGFASYQQNLTYEVRAKGLPVGMQIIGPQFSDWQIIQVAKLYEEVRGELPGPEI